MCKQYVAAENHGHDVITDGPAVHAPFLLPAPTTVSVPVRVVGPSCAHPVLSGSVISPGPGSLECRYSNWECTWNIDVYIKFNLLILDLTILERLRDKWLFVKILSYDGRIFFIRYVNNIKSKINELNLI
jgi:hypothetical protein